MFPVSSASPVIEMAWPLGHFREKPPAIIYGPSAVGVISTPSAMCFVLHSQCFYSSTFHSLASAFRLTARVEVVDRRQIVHCLVEHGVEIGVLRDAVLRVDILHDLDMNIVRKRPIE